MERPFDTASSLSAARLTAARRAAHEAEYLAADAAFAHCRAARDTYYAFADELAEHGYPNATDKVLDCEEAFDLELTPSDALYWVAALSAATVRARHRLADEGIDINDLLGRVVY